MLLCIALGLHQLQAGLRKAVFAVDLGLRQLLFARHLGLLHLLFGLQLHRFRVGLLGFLHRLSGLRINLRRCIGVNPIIIALPDPHIPHNAVNRFEQVFRFNLPLQEALGQHRCQHHAGLNALVLAVRAEPDPHNHVNLIGPFGGIDLLVLPVNLDLERLAFGFHQAVFLGEQPGNGFSQVAGDIFFLLLALRLHQCGAGGGLVQRVCIKPLVHPRNAGAAFLLANQPFHCGDRLADVEGRLERLHTGCTTANADRAAGNGVQNIVVGVSVGAVAVHNRTRHVRQRQPIEQLPGHERTA